MFPKVSILAHVFQNSSAYAYPYSISHAAYNIASYQVSYSQLLFDFSIQGHLGNVDRIYSTIVLPYAKNCQLNTLSICQIKKSSRKPQNQKNFQIHPVRDLSMTVMVSNKEMYTIRYKLFRGITQKRFFNRYSCVF